uniref:uncharacterized protein n=1 Tax=Pristiophorus japonicus TaxID=55135 RepID=UPI00398F4302
MLKQPPSLGHPCGGAPSQPETVSFSSIPERPFSFSPPPSFPLKIANSQRRKSTSILEAHTRHFQPMLRTVGQNVLSAGDFSNWNAESSTIKGLVTHRSASEPVQIEGQVQPEQVHAFVESKSRLGQFEEIPLVCHPTMYPCSVQLQQTFQDPYEAVTYNNFPAFALSLHQIPTEVNLQQQIYSQPLSCEESLSGQTFLPCPIQNLMGHMPQMVQMTSHTVPARVLHLPSHFQLPQDMTPKHGQHWKIGESQAVFPLTTKVFLPMQEDKDAQSEPAPTGIFTRNSVGTVNTMLTVQHLTVPHSAPAILPQLNEDRTGSIFEFQVPPVQVESNGIQIPVPPSTQRIYKSRRGSVDLSLEDSQGIGMYSRLQPVTEEQIVYFSSDTVVLPGDFLRSRQPMSEELSQNLSPQRSSDSGQSTSSETREFQSPPPPPPLGSTAPYTNLSLCYEQQQVLSEHGTHYETLQGVPVSLAGQPPVLFQTNTEPFMAASGTAGLYLQVMEGSWSHLVSSQQNLLLDHSSADGQSLPLVLEFQVFMPFAEVYLVFYKADLITEKMHSSLQIRNSLYCSMTCINQSFCSG